MAAKTQIHRARRALTPYQADVLRNAPKRWKTARRMGVFWPDGYIIANPRTLKPLSYQGLCGGDFVEILHPHGTHRAKVSPMGHMVIGLLQKEEREKDPFAPHGFSADN